jgi:adenosylcobinamide amidohydrolase
MLRPELVDRDTLLVSLETRMRSLGTTVYGGGLGWIDSVIFRRVEKCFSNPSPREYARSLASRFGKNPAVFLTAADVNEYIHVSLERDEVRVEMISTIGLTHPACIGYEPAGPGEIGTINIFLATSIGLSETGLTDLFRSVSEAKAGIISTLGLSCKDLPAVGTVSDATMVASPTGSNDYAGLGTLVGSLASRAVLETVKRYMEKKTPADYLRYIGLGISTEHRKCDPTELLIERITALVKHLRGVRLLPWIGDEHFIKVLESLGTLRKGCLHETR